MAQAKEDLVAEDVRITTEREALDLQAQQTQAHTFRLTQDQNATNEVMRRRHQKTQSRLPPVYDPRNIFHTPGAGPSNPSWLSPRTGNPSWLSPRAGADHVATPGDGAPFQSPVMGPPRVNMAPPQYVPTPPGHYSNPLENMIAAATQLATL